MLWDLLLYLHADMMPRYQIFFWLWFWLWWWWGWWRWWRWWRWWWWWRWRWRWWWWFGSHRRDDIGVTSEQNLESQARHCPVNCQILSEIMPIKFQRGDVKIIKNTRRTSARQVAEVLRSKDCDTIGRCFGMSTDTNSWHVDGHHHFRTSTDTLLACWRRQFCLACRREQPFWHVDGSFGMLTRRIPPSERSCEDPGEIRYEVLVWSSRGPCAKILWKSWWHSLKDPCLISNMPCIRGACNELVWDVVGVSCKKILTVRSSQEGPSMTILSDSLCGLGMKILIKRKKFLLLLLFGCSPALPTLISYPPTRIGISCWNNFNYVSWWV